MMESDLIDQQHTQLCWMKNEIEKNTNFSQISSSVPLCSFCEPPNSIKQAETRCVDCKKNICEGCLKLHNKYTKDHKMVKISEKNGELFMSLILDPPLQIVSCNTHSVEKKTFLCLQCNVSVCGLCITKGDHKGHESALLSDVVEEKKSQTLSLIDSVQSRRQEIETSLKLIGLMETNVQLSYYTQVDQINKIKDILIDELGERSKDKLDRLSKQKKRLERDLKSLENSVSFSRFVVRNSTHDQFISHYGSTQETERE